ncbi:hypothetical protein BOTNAR_0023g00060 [Botryotinia narcissicola]|uniref:Uncharacterized protein n=1 Tax=Botryotinia narcissicola TaxID=278944 RepID=A0A4Z1J4G6_9HELO|nr:hypothetical protein BOTNAR_0023g00060 [Botryotinia narcissicola]
MNISNSSFEEWNIREHVHVLISTQGNTRDSVTPRNGNKFEVRPPIWSQYEHSNKFAQFANGFDFISVAVSGVEKGFAYSVKMSACYCKAIYTLIKSEGRIAFAKNLNNLGQDLWRYSSNG